MKTLINTIRIIGVAVLFTACTKTEVRDFKPTANIDAMRKTDDIRVTANHSELMPTLNVVSAFMDWHPYSLKIARKFIGPAAKELIAQTPVVRSIYLYDPGQTLDREGKPFSAKINSVRSLHGEQIVWKEYLIRFGRGVTPQQFYAVQDIESMMQITGGQVQVAETGNVYQGVVYSPQMLPSEKSE